MCGCGMQLCSRWGTSDVECPGNWKLISKHDTVWPGSRYINARCRNVFDVCHQQPQSSAAVAAPWANISGVRVARIVPLRLPVALEARGAVPALGQRPAGVLALGALRLTPGHKVRPAAFACTVILGSIAKTLQETKTSTECRGRQRHGTWRKQHDTWR